MVSSSATTTTTTTKAVTNRYRNTYYHCSTIRHKHTIFRMIVLLSYIASIIVMMMMMTIITATATSSCYTVPTLTLTVKTSVPAFINKKLTKQQQRRMNIQQLQFLKTSTRMTVPTTMSRRSLSATPNEEIVEAASTVISSTSPLPGVQQQQQHNHQDQSSIDDGTSPVVESTTTTTTISTSTTTVTASRPLSTLVSPTTESSLSSLFASTSSSSNTAFNFGQSVSIRDRPTTTDSSTTANSTSTTATTTKTSSSSSSSSLDEQDVVTSIRRRNLGVAVTSIGLALSKYLYSYYNPIQPIQLLVDMTVSSPSVSVIGINGKPTIIDFWAPWCDTCKALAPTIYTVKEQYSSRINFISINGDDPLSYNIVSAFRVDAIPHIAFVSSSGNVQTALIGPVPLSVLQANLDALLLEPTNDDDNKIKLPYTMFDAFENSSSRRIRFVDKQ